MPNLLIEEERLADRRAARHAAYVRWRDKMRADPALREKIRRYKKRWMRNNLPHLAEYNRNWRRENPERARAANRRNKRNQTRRLTPSRVVTNLNVRLRLFGADALKVADVPTELIQAERAKILLGRRIRAKRRKLKKTTNQRKSNE